MKIKDRPPVKILAGLPLEAKMDLATWGTNLNPNAITAALSLLGAIDAEESLAVPGNLVGAKRVRKERARRSCIAMFYSACASMPESDLPNFFREMAVVIERRRNPPDPRLRHLACYLYLDARKKQKPPTVPDLVRELQRCGLPTTRNQVKRYLRYLEIKPTRGLAGRRPLKVIN